MGYSAFKHYFHGIVYRIVTFKLQTLGLARKCQPFFATFRHTFVNSIQYFIVFSYIYGICQLENPAFLSFCRLK